MDTSEQYTRQCDCSEIQGKWQANAGDFYFIRDRLCRPTGAVDVYDGGGHALLPRDANYGWLPRQDQIQEMVGIKDTSLLIHKFCKFCYQDSITNLMEGGSYLVFRFSISISMEQLWLAFYMYEKHRKIWDRKEWIK